jgi:1-deoxyxylulose-5-phosphate synthase
MDERPLGRTGLAVSVVGLGTAALALPYGPPAAQRRPPARRDAVRVVAAALDRGITFLDTAPGYDGAEDIVGEALGGRECVVATKVSPPPSGWAGADATTLGRHVRGSVEASLARLRVPRIDVLQAHNATRESLADGPLAQALADVRNAGLVAATGATVYAVEEARAAIREDTFDVVQVPYSVLDRRFEAVLDDAVATGTAVVARSVLLRGVLSEHAASLGNGFTPLRVAVEAFMKHAGATWADLPGAAVAAALAERRIASVLLGPRDERELVALLDAADSFATNAVPPPYSLPDDLLDPRRWPQEAVHG